MAVRVVVLLVIALLASGCRREEEDLNGAFDRRQGQCEDKAPSDSGSVEPPVVQLTDSQRFLSSAESGNLADVQALVEDGKIDPKITDVRGRNALMLAAEMGHVPVVEFLLGIAPDLAKQQDKNGLTAEDYVLASSILDEAKKQALSKILRGETASQEELDAELLSLLIDGFSQQNLERIQALLGRGANPNLEDSRIQATPVPALFLSMGVRVSESNGRLSLQADPVYPHAQALVQAGANIEAAVVLRGRPFTPRDLVNSPGAASRFADQKADWDALFNR
jgi:hypothetical protein